MSRQFATNVTTIYDIFCPVPFLPSPFGFRRASGKGKLPCQPKPLNLRGADSPPKFGGGPWKALLKQGNLFNTIAAKIITKKLFTNQKYPQYCWEFHDQLWEALSGTNSEKRGVPSRTGGERILETLWKPQMPWIVGFGASQPYSRGKFQETLWERFRGLSGSFPEFLPESPSRTGGKAQQRKCFGVINFVIITKESRYKCKFLGLFLAKRDPPVAATLQRKSSGGIIFVIITNCRFLQKKWFQGIIL